MSRPIDIAHSNARNSVAITWDDDTTSELPVPYLRGWCPCAACQGHGIEVRYREPKADVKALGIYEMGAYAISIRFSDQHDSGIYSWEWLRRIAPETEPKGYKTGAFFGGSYREG